MVSVIVVVVVIVGCANRMNRYFQNAERWIKDLNSTLINFVSKTKTIIYYINFIVYIIMNCFLSFLFTELVRSFRKSQGDAPVHPAPIRLNVNYIESMNLGVTYRLRAGFHTVGTDDKYEYIIGVILHGDLYPILARRADQRNTFNRVKVRIDGDIANVTVPILSQDPLSIRFFKPFGSQNIASAEIDE